MKLLQFNGYGWNEAIAIDNAEKGMRKYCEEYDLILDAHVQVSGSLMFRSTNGKRADEYVYCITVFIPEESA